MSNGQLHVTLGHLTTELPLNQVLSAICYDGEDDICGALIVELQLDSGVSLRIPERSAGMSFVLGQLRQQSKLTILEA